MFSSSSNDNSHKWLTKMKYKFVSGARRQTYIQLATWAIEIFDRKLIE